ncbi:hypothetical protein DMENIID0001_084620 [Sergentomyia squamirostris]
MNEIKVEKDQEFYLESEIKVENEEIQTEDMIFVKEEPDEKKHSIPENTGDQDQPAKKKKKINEVEVLPLPLRVTDPKHWDTSDIAANEELQENVTHRTYFGSSPSPKPSVSLELCDPSPKTQVGKNPPEAHKFAIVQRLVIRNHHSMEAPLDLSMKKPEVPLSPRSSRISQHFGNLCKIKPLPHPGAGLENLIQ